MGLDVVELVMDLEKRFNIALEDCSLVRVRTVADLAALVISRMSRVPDVCPTATTFYRLRALLVSTFGVERRSFRPGARLADVLPEDARSAWSSIQRFAPGVPPLFRETDGTGVSIDPTVVVFTFFGVVACLMTAPVVAFGLPALLIVAWAVHRVHRPRPRFVLPTGVSTVSDLVQRAAPISVWSVESGQRLLNEQRVLEEVRVMVADFLGAEREAVRPESRLIEDLGMD